MDTTKSTAAQPAPTKTMKTKTTAATAPSGPMRHKTGTKPDFTYPCTLVIELGQSPRKDKGMVKRAICKENGEDYTRTIPYVTLRGAFKSKCDLRKDSADSKWYRISKVDGKPVEKVTRKATTVAKAVKAANAVKSAPAKSTAKAAKKK